MSDSSFVRIIMAAQAAEGTTNSERRKSTWNAVIEVTLMMFFIAIIPRMIVLDPQNIHWYDFWEPVLSAMLAALYTYVRARNIDLEENVKNERD